jgi:hypothetical protein
VKKASCENGGPALEIEAESGTFLLHSPAMGGVQISMPFKAPAGFNVCKSLADAKVTVKYEPDSKDMSGTLVMIDILSLAENTTMNAPLVKYRANAIAGETTTAEGKVTDVTCTGHEMQLNILVQGATAALHARDYSRIEVEQEVSFQTGDFNPCTDLKDKNALITFVVIDHKSYTGEIQRIEVEK